MGLWANKVEELFVLSEDWLLEANLGGLGFIPLLELSGCFRETIEEEDLGFEIFWWFLVDEVDGWSGNRSVAAFVVLGRLATLDLIFAGCFVACVPSLDAFIDADFLEPGISEFLLAVAGFCVFVDETGATLALLTPSLAELLAFRGPSLGIDLLDIPDLSLATAVEALLDKVTTVP